MVMNAKALLPGRLFSLFIRWTVLLLFLLIVLLPLVWLLVSSFLPNRVFFSRPLAFTSNRWDLRNYAGVLQAQPMLRYLLNSLFVSLVSAATGSFIALLSAFVFLFRFALKRLFYSLMVFGLFVPTSAFMIPYFLMISRIGLYDSLPGIALVYAGVSLPTAFLIVSTHMREAVYGEFIEASFLDGASLNQTFARIAAPLSLPGAMTASIFLLIIGWNELLYALLLSQNDGSRTVQVAISFLVATYTANFTEAFAAMILAMLPVVVIYIFLNKRIVAGLGMAAGLK
jgi:raffinose/stachyose/melibiose transport system permease protein